MPSSDKEEMKMKKFSAKEYYKDFTITSMNWSDRAVHICWKLPSKNIQSESCLYRHSDGSWHLDGESRQYGIQFAKALSSQMAQFFLYRICPAAEEPEYTGPSELARIERQLKREDEYRRAVEKKKSEKQDKPRRISAWHAPELL